MKIVDTSAAMLWRRPQGSRKVVASGGNQVDQTLRNKLRELHRRTTTTMVPAASGNYAEGRAALKFYRQGFVNIDSFNDAYTRSMQNARLSDKEIEDLIERMNLTPR